MRRVRVWEWVVLSLGAVALAATAVRAAWPGDRPRVADSLRMVDVTTGELVELPVGPGGAMIPAINPRTGARTLMPIVPDGSGGWRLAGRYAAALEYVEGDTREVVDAETLGVRVR